MGSFCFSMKNKKALISCKAGAAPSHSPVADFASVFPCERKQADDSLFFLEKLKDYLKTKDRCSFMSYVGLFTCPKNQIQLLSSFFSRCISSITILRESAPSYSTAYTALQMGISMPMSLARDHALSAA